ncbi:heparan-alpha-glucosaminide N-acetyltransferase domain-containing protein [Massilia kyonggiensis]|nr:heparan-alpha-glucosaminide N-acetyltransferase domain-containing protein [Massilia kyonggiensis]
MNGQRIVSIDVMRGLVMLLMTVDHVRETFYLQHQVGDPMDVGTTPPALFFTRLAAHFCAPMFVFLTGLSAWLYAHPPGGPRSATGFLARRGLLLLALEVTVVNAAWSGTALSTIYLQVIWAIGLAMLALALLHRLPLPVLGLLGLVIVGGHNALEQGTLPSAAWTILEQRGFLALDPVRIKVSYPVLAWIGVILLGYACGPLYARAAALRMRRLTLAGIACLALLIVLRSMNGYGEPVPWTPQADGVHATMAFLNFTKYPPSLDFLLLTLGVGCIALAWIERVNTVATRVAAVFGGAPLFYYLLHLYALLVLQKLAAAALGVPRADVAHVWQVWAIAALLAAVLYLPTRLFGSYKRTSGKGWVKYF